MATTISTFLGTQTEYFAAAGAVAVSYIALRVAFSFLKGIRTYFLSAPLGLGQDLKRTGQWAVVTGSTDGIGKGYAHQLAKLGLHIVLISRTEAKLREVAAEIESTYKVKTKIIAADFSRGTEIYDDIKHGVMGLDIGILVNNVGLSYDFPEFFLEVVDREKVRLVPVEFDELLRVFMNLLHVNCTSMTMMSSIVMPGMVERKRGVVINIASAAGDLPTPLLSVYSACKMIVYVIEESGVRKIEISFRMTYKSYVKFLSDCLAYEYKSKGITVQCVAPYFVVSKMSKLRRANLFVPTPATFVRSALATVGLESDTTGYWAHALTGSLARSVYEPLVKGLIYRMFLVARKAGRAWRARKTAKTK